MTRTRGKGNLSSQMRRRVNKPAEEETPKYEGPVISTGSTLLDLAISGGVIRGGGIRGGIFVEAFGPNGSGKTVLLSEVAGAIQRQGGDVMFHDPEARLNKQFASIFDMDFDSVTYTQPNTVTELFTQVRAWEPTTPKKINGVMADSLAALSTNLEMAKEEGDKMGMRRAKEFSEELRKTCRILTQKNWLMVCSNQVRTKADAGKFEEKFTTPGGQAVPFYASLRLQFRPSGKIKRVEKIAGKEVTRIVGTETTVIVYKSSLDKPFRSAPLYILFDYGIDDVRANLEFLKKYTKATTFICNGEKLAVSLEVSIKMIEEQGLEKDLKENVIDLWEEIELKFKTERKKKVR